MSVSGVSMEVEGAIAPFPDGTQNLLQDTILWLQITPNQRRPGSTGVAYSTPQTFIWWGGAG